MYSWHVWTYTYVLDIDIEGDTPTFDAILESSTNVPLNP